MEQSQQLIEKKLNFEPPMVARMNKFPFEKTEAYSDRNQYDGCCSCLEGNFYMCFDPSWCHCYS